ncbi:methyl-accepting chemotaxis protein [Bacillus sp. FJAT-49736]|uniref:methyl-accepting chemotaxis protein n=1 Tax=Bacillus sp. FJAT-49736 TaxID=2833582 RepID=UPI001BC93307|nr:methyl-accepting chemotaxis protein [Bacillus sp. FJAT-49736]MBS4174243.1 HAMP domain-containing protein [Bacillus sp. FJAT-49736]
MKLTISKKLILSFLSIAILLGIASSISIYYLHKIDDSDTDLINRRAVVLTNAQKIQVETEKQLSNLRGYLIKNDMQYKMELNSANENTAKLIKSTIKLTKRDVDKQRLRNLDELNQQMNQKYEQLFQLVQENKKPEDILYFYERELLPIGKKMAPISDEMANEQQKLMNEGSESNSKMVNAAVLIVTIISIIAFLLSIVIGVIMSGKISKPIVKVVKVAEQIAHGDLTPDDIQVKNTDEIGILAAAFNQMKENLRLLVSKVSLSAEQVASASEELTASAEQTSKATEMITFTIQEMAVSSEKQLESVHEGVESMNEMSTDIHEIAENGKVTSNVSVQASEKAMEGNKAIQLAVKQMDSVNSTMTKLAQVVRVMDEHSKEIGNIIEVITNIASQTNLLALNAAIEAARAGENGKGFAVVAEEVRTLAEQSSESAKQITQLITNIQDYTSEAVQQMEAGTREVNQGTQLVDTAGRLFEEIKSSVDQVASQIQEISGASEQMSASSTQVVHSIDTISKESQNVSIETQNISSASEEQLASMEEISASASSLAKMAEELQQLIGTFKV